MEENISNTITSLYQEIKTRQEIRLLIPMGYVPGLPLITIRNEQLVAIIPFLRYKITGEVDRTLIFPVRYTMEYLVPEKQLVKFQDLSVEPGFEDTDFNQVIGFFRHEAIKNLNKHEYEELRKKTLSGYDSIVADLLDEDYSLAPADEEAFLHNIHTIIEPSVLPIYRKLDKDFYNKYLK